MRMLYHLCDVEGGVEMVVSIQARVMVVGVPGGDKQRDGHWQQKHEQRINPIVGEEQAEKQNLHKKHGDEDATVFGELVAGFVGAGITGAGDDHGVFQLAHDCAIGAFPGRLVHFLVHIILVVANNVVQEPGVAGDAGDERIHDLQKAIEDRLMEGGQMLMVMAKGADAGLVKDANYHPGCDHPQGGRLEVDEEVNRKCQHEEKDRQTISFVAKELRFKDRILGTEFWGQLEEFRGSL